MFGHLLIYLSALSSLVWDSKNAAFLKTNCSKRRKLIYVKPAILWEFIQNIDLLSGLLHKVIWHSLRDLPLFCPFPDRIEVPTHVLGVEVNEGT
jgi:hypothetical protein